jgi:hypothetical protein
MSFRLNPDEPVPSTSPSDEPGYETTSSPMSFKLKLKIRQPMIAIKTANVFFLPMFIPPTGHKSN